MTFFKKICICFIIVKNGLTSVRNAHFKIFFLKYISQNFQKESAVGSLTAGGSSGEVRKKSSAQTREMSDELPENLALDPDHREKSLT